MDKLQNIITIISLTITLLTIIYKSGYKNNHDRERRYYNKILMPFFEKNALNNEFDIIKFCEKKVKYSDEDIPMYVRFLINHNEEEKLKKVLMIDYINLYKNDINTICNITTLVEKIIFYLKLLVEFVLIILGTGLIIFSFLKMLSERNISDLVLIIFGIIVFIIYIFLMKNDISWHEDRYALNTKGIQKHIAKKIKLYEKQKDKYYFIH